MILALGFALLACERTNDVTKPEVGTETASGQRSITDDSPVLATVNGEGISQADVKFMIARTFSSADSLLANKEINDKVLDSLIASKAMSQKIKQEMSAEQLTDIQRKVNAFREELFVREYLMRSVVPTPVTQEMVSEYYQGHPEKFGGTTLKVFEQLKASRKLTESERDHFLADQQSISTSSDWQQIAAQSQDKYPLNYQKASAVPGLLDPKLDAVIKNLSLGNTSGTIFIDELPMVFRVLEEKQIPAQPLHEVSAGIRKSLAPIQMRQAVKQVTDELLKEVHVEKMDSSK